MSHLPLPVRPSVTGPDDRADDPRPTGLRSPYGIGVVLVLLIAFGLRLVTVLRGGGLFGMVGYDGAVYYAAAAGLAHGLLPYRDFLLLHPPGIVLALLPFAVLGRLIGDPAAFAVARLAWMLLGAVNAFLVVRVLRPYGTQAAMAGGLGYAVFVPALYSEHSTSLEALGSTGLLGAVLLLTRAARIRPTSHRAYVVAGILLGASAGIKIWAVVLVLALVGWAVPAAGVRRAAAILGGSVLGVTAVCLPFFVAAPSTMWRLVVVDQLGRRQASDSLTARWLGISGLSEIHVRHTTVLVVLAAAALGGLAVLAVRIPLGRLALLLTVVTVGLLLVTPSWSIHYTGLVGPPAALLVGSAVAAGSPWLSRPAPRRIGAVLGLAGLALHATLSLPALTFGSTFSPGPLRASIAATPGCLTSDDPTVLIETDTLQRNLDLGCPLVADLGGYSYDLQPGASLRTSRAKNVQWQDFAHRYLVSGRVTMVARFRTDPGYSRSTRKVIAGWPVLARSGPFELRQPGKG